MMALRFDIFVTPIDSTTVTTAARPSGIAATASDTAIMNESSITSTSKLPARSICTANTTTQFRSSSQVRFFVSCVSFICRI